MDAAIFYDEQRIYAPQSEKTKQNRNFTNLAIQLILLAIIFTHQTQSIVFVGLQSQTDIIHVRSFITFFILAHLMN